MEKISRDILLLSTIFLLFCMLSLLISCQQKNVDAQPPAKRDTLKESSLSLNYKKITYLKTLLKDGELITRSSNDFESMIFQNFSRRERAYSHSGIVFKEDNNFIVYHCIEGAENPGGHCKREPFDSFINPLQKTGLGIFQYQLSGMETEKLHAILKKNFDSKVPFDISFNLQTDDSLYCSEMIYKALKQATNNRVILPSSYIENFRPKIMGYKNNHLFFKKFEFIGIDDLYLNPFCKEIIRIKYQ